MTIEQIAAICHEANRALCEQTGDDTQKTWTNAEQWQRDSSTKGVVFALENPDAPASAQHDAWLEDKRAAGWVYGEVKDPEAKTHPCCVPYEALPDNERAKDHLFKAVVNGLASFVE